MIMGSCLDQRGRLSNYKSMHEFFDHTGSDPGSWFLSLDSVSQSPLDYPIETIYLDISTRQLCLMPELTRLRRSSRAFARQI